MERMENLAKKYNISLIILFGSQAKGDTHSHSDTDVAFLPEKDISTEDELNLIGELGGILKSDIDSVNLKKASPLILYHVFKYGKPLYEKERGLFSEYLAQSYRMYEEALPLYEARLALL